MSKELGESDRLEEEVIYFSKDLGRLSDKLSDNDLATIILEVLGKERVGNIIKILLNK